ncbi:CHAT domain-containing protein [Trichophaea hybrida]|nr:CHAT domain-containing protein [Trichophaea hybrida]
MDSDADFQAAIANFGPRPSISGLHAMERVIEAMKTMHTSFGEAPESDSLHRDLQLVIPQVQFLLATMHPMANDADRAALLHLLCDMYQAKHVQTKAMDDLQQAITYAEDTMLVLPSDDADTLKAMLTHLSAMQSSKYKKTKEMDDLQQTITWAEQAVAATYPGDPRGKSNLEILCRAFNDLYERTGDIDDLNQVIQLTEETIKAIPKDNPERAIAMSELASSLQNRYGRTGAISDLQKSTSYATDALAATPPGDHDRAIRLNNMANKYYDQYLRTSELGQLQQAIKFAEEAVEELSRQKCTCYSDAVFTGLSICLHRRYEHEQKGNMDDLDQAIMWAERAVEVNPSDDPDHAMRLANLATKLLAKYEAVNKRENTYIRNATDMDDERLIDILVNPIESRLEKLRISELDKAIMHIREALKLLPPGHIHRARMLLQAGWVIEARYWRMYMLQDLQEAEQCFSEAWKDQNSPPKFRIWAAEHAANLFMLEKDFQQASSCMTGAVEILPLASPRSLQRDDQQYMLSLISGLAPKAASLALQAGEGAVKALCLLEQGRGVIMGFTIDLRSELSVLRTNHRSLFDEFDQLRTEIDAATPELESLLRGNVAKVSGAESYNAKEMEEDGLQRRQCEVLYKELDLVLARIRKLPGYEGFLLPPTPDAMMEMAKDGPIVVFNSTTLRSDAIIVTADGINALRLPSLEYNEAEENALKMNRIFEDSRRSTRGRRNIELSRLLRWLWDTAVGPVCTELRLREHAKGGELPRVWWIGAGVLSRAPFHAAGDHFDKSSKNDVISIASSSFIPTIKALSYARQDILAEPRPEDALLALVSMPETPGHQPLKGVEKEIVLIKEAAEKSSVQFEEFSKPAKRHVLENISRDDPQGRARLVHFACHGLSDSVNPLESHILLLNDEDMQVQQAEALTVREISSTRIKRAHLAFLSACHTANNSVTPLADEAIHVVSGFQLAGFKHVIGNMWKADDKFCVKVAGGFYRFLFETAKAEPDARLQVAKALHNAVKAVRDEHQKDLIGWIPFVHFGA